MDYHMRWHHVVTCCRVMCAYYAYLTIRRALGVACFGSRHFVNTVSGQHFSAENKQEAAEFDSQHLPMHFRGLIWKIKSKSNFPVSFSLISAEMNLVGNYQTLRGLRTVNPEGLPSTNAKKCSRHGMVGGSRCWLASGLPLSARSRQHRLCRIKCCTRRDDGVPAPARFRLCRRRPQLRWQSRLRRRASAPGWRHNWNCSTGLSEWRKLTCSAFSGFPTNFGSLSHQLSPSCREPSLTCTAQLTGIGGSSFLSRKCASSSVFILFTLYTGESNQSIALEASVSCS